MTGPGHSLIDARRLRRRTLPSLLRYKFLHEYGYDKGAVVVSAIVDDICGVVRHYYTRPGDLEPGQLIYNAPAVTERGRRGKTIGQTKLIPVRLTIVADEDIEAIRNHASAGERCPGIAAGRSSLEGTGVALWRTSPKPGDERPAATREKGTARSRSCRTRPPGVTRSAGEDNGEVLSVGDRSRSPPATGRTPFSPRTPTRSSPRCSSTSSTPLTSARCSLWASPVAAGGRSSSR